MSQSKRGEKLKEKGNELFFVRVKEPNEVRRNILETLKEIVETLQRFEKFKGIRQEKLGKINKLRGLLKDANKMFGNLKAKMPQTNLRAVVVKETSRRFEKSSAKTSRKKRKNAKQAGEKPEAKAPKKEMTEMEKLESELSAIEGKLKSLT